MWIARTEKKKKRENRPSKILKITQDVSDVLVKTEYFIIYIAFRNVRVSYSRSSAGSVEVLEENNYYPFGLKHQGYNFLTGNPAYNYQYNGKELQKETGWNDYGARMYMSDIGRWGVVDPLAETSRRFTPYNYAFNNPISFIDPDGRRAMSPAEKDPSSMGFGNGMLSYYASGGKGSRANIMAFSGQQNYSLEGVYDAKPWTGEGGNDSYTLTDPDDIAAFQRSLSGQNYFKEIDFTKFGLDDPTPIRKYLKNKSTFNRWGIETTEVQYQLDHANAILEMKQIISTTEEFTDKIDNVVDWTPAINGIKGFYDYVKEGAKSLNPITLILMLGSTTISIENSIAKGFLEMYRNVQSKYIDIHSNNPSNMKGITVNIDMIKGPQNHIWSRYSFYDINTHRYLGGRTFE